VVEFDWRHSIDRPRNPPVIRKDLRDISCIGRVIADFVPKWQQGLSEGSFYCARHFSAKRGIAIACRLSVRPSVHPSVTLVNCGHIDWNSSKVISPLVSLGRSLFATPTWRVSPKGKTPKFGPKVTHPLLISASETFDRKLRPNGYR